MSTQSFPANAVNLFVGTEEAALTGSMTVLMKTRKFYTDGTELLPMVEYVVERAWGETAVERGWAEDVDKVLPINASPATLTAVEAAVVQAMVSGNWPTPIEPTLVVVGDSFTSMSMDPPRSTFGATTVKGSYSDASNVKQVGVTNIYAENPVRLKFRAAHNLVTGDEGRIGPLPQPHPLAYRRARCTVVSATEITLDGIDARAMAPLASAAQSSDMLFRVDMSWGNFGLLSWMLHESGYPFSRVDVLAINGAKSDYMLQTVPGLWTRTTPYTHGILHIGRNDLAFDEASIGGLLDYMLERCGTVMAVATFPDSDWTTPANDAAAAKINAIAAYLHGRQALNHRLRVCDLFGVFSDPELPLQSTVGNYIGSDGTHPTVNGARVGGITMARDLFGDLNPARRTLSRVADPAANRLTGARFTGAAGTVGTGVTGTVATGFVVGSRSSANVTGYAQLCRTPAVPRRNGVAVAAGATLDIGDGYWYVCKTAGTLAASLPAGYATAGMFDSTTGVTDGTAVLFRIPRFTTSLEIVNWQYLDMQITAGNAENISFHSSSSVPALATAGEYLRAQCEVVEAGGYSQYATCRLSCIDAASAQLARAHGLAVNNTMTNKPVVDIRPRTIQTPPLRVPDSTARAEFRLTVSCALEGAQFFVSLPMIEAVDAGAVV